MENYSVRYARPTGFGRNATRGSVAVWDDEKNCVAARYIYSWENPREVYRQMDIICRLMSQGKTIFDAETIAENRTNPPHELTRKTARKVGYAADERPGLYPIRENECDETNPEIINDWLTDSYAAEFGLECGDAVNEQDLYYYFLTHFNDDMPVPHYLEEEARRWDGIEEFTTFELDPQDWTITHHAEPIHY